MKIEPKRASAPAAARARLTLLRALADATRLQLLRALDERPHCLEELALRLGKAASTLSFHLRKLEEAELVGKQRTQYYVLYALRRELLDLTLRDVVVAPAAASDREHGRLERYRDQVLRTFFDDGKLVKLPKQWRKRVIVLDELARLFAPGRRYAEHEVNELVATRFDDYCTIRRQLVDEGFMARDDQAYWRLPEEASVETREPKTKKDLKREYKQAPRRAGIYKIENTKTGRVLLGSARNLHGPLNSHRFQLMVGSHRNTELQRDWRELGPDAFTFEVLEELVVRNDDPEFSLDDELTRLEAKWSARLEPFGERGYNRRPLERD